MNSPALLLAVVLVLLSASVYHAAFGKSLRGFFVTVLAAFSGFLLGEALARGLGHERFALGQIHLLHALLGAWLGMGIAARRWP